MRRLVIVLVVACRPAPPHATAIDADRAHVALAELDRGRELLITKCGGSCHRPPLPSDHTAGEWPAKLDEMAGRARLEPEQRHLIEEYVTAMARR
jgi:hypothetical protein